MWHIINRKSSERFDHAYAPPHCQTLLKNAEAVHTRIMGTVENVSGIKLEGQRTLHFTGQNWSDEMDHCDGQPVKSILSLALAGNMVATLSDRSSLGLAARLGSRGLETDCKENQGTLVHEMSSMSCET